MTRRLGVGKVRHLDTSLLWIQSKVREGDITVQKIEGANNCADIMTKYVDRPLLQRLLQRMSLSVETGRAESAPQLVTSFIDTTIAYYANTSTRARYISSPTAAPVLSLKPTKELMGADLRDWVQDGEELVYVRPHSCGENMHTCKHEDNTDDYCLCGGCSALQCRDLSVCAACEEGLRS